MLGKNNNKRNAGQETQEKVLDVDASMQGTLTFKDPVNLRINGSFEGVLDTKGMLSIGEQASVKAAIAGDAVHIAGEVIGDVRAAQGLEISSTGRLIGDVETPSISIQKGGVMQGRLNMIAADANGAKKTEKRFFMNADELASYLAVEKNLIFEWASSGKLPAVREGSAWKFEKSKVDEWVASGRIK